MAEVPRTVQPMRDLNYYDQRSVELSVAISPLEAWNLIMAGPQPVLHVAFRIRDSISARFGVKRIGGFSGTRKEAVQAGDYLDFFLVEHIGPDLLILTERDRHLDVMTCISTKEKRVTVTSSVVTHNLFGRACMVPVGVAHKLIVTAMLRRLKRRAQARR